MKRRVLWSVASALVAVGACGDGSPSHDAGDGRLDARPRDAAVGDSESLDAGVDAGGTVPPELLCAAGTPRRDVPCPVQTPADTSGCEPGGRVVFDGELCTAAARTDCGGEPAAFNTFEECAAACAGAGACDGMDMRGPDGQFYWTELHPSTVCDEIWVCIEQRGDYEVPEALCTLGTGWELDCGPFGDDETYACGDALRCRSFVPISPDFHRELCALSLIPSVGLIRCWVWV